MPIVVCAVIGHEQVGLCWMDGLTVVLDDCPTGEHVRLTEVRARTPRHASRFESPEVLADLELLDDDNILRIRSWINRRTSELLAGFASDVRALVLTLSCRSY